MKDLVLLPLKFVLILLFLLALCAGFQLVVSYASVSQAVRQQFVQHVAGLVALNWQSWFFPIVGFCTLLTLTGIYRRRTLRWVKLPALFVLVAASVFGMTYVQAGLAGRGQLPAGFDFNVPPKVVLPFDTGYLVANEDADGKVLGVMYHAESNADFELFPDAVKNPATRAVVLGERGVSAPAQQFMGIRANPVQMPAYYQAPFTALGGASGHLFRLAGSGFLQRAAVAASVAFILVALWLFVRLGKWPLFNAMVAFVALGAVLLLANAIDTEWAKGLFAFVPDPYKDFTLPAVYTVLAALLTGISLFLPSLREKGGAAA